MVKITIATVVCSDKTETLTKYLESIISAQHFEELEILILVNGKNAIMEDLLTQYHLKYQNIRFLSYTKQTRGEARNTLIKHAKGDIVYFLDDDVIVRGDTFSILLENIRKYKNVDIIGGPNLTPMRSHIFKICQGCVLASFFGTLWMSQRYKSSGKARIANERSLILCNLAVKRKIFEESKVFFDTFMVCAEENLLLQKLISAGYKALYVPGLIVHHERRDNYIKFCEQIFIYGRGRAQVIKFLHSVDNMIYFIPGVFIVYVISLFFYNKFIYNSPIYIYIVLCFLNSMKISFSNMNFKLFWISFILFPSVHMFYGAGFIFELFNARHSACK